MMGLLDNLDDPKTAGLLSLGLGLLNSRGNFGQALGQAGQQAMQQMQAMKLAKQQEEERKQRQQMQQMQMQQMQFQMQQAQAQEAQRKQQEAQRMAYLDSLDQNAGPAMPLSVPGALKAGLSSAEIGAIAPAAKDAKPMVVGRSLVDPMTGKPIYTDPAEDKPTEIAKLVKEMNALPPGHPLRSVYQSAISKATTHAPGTVVSVNTGQKGLDNEFKLRGEFKGEPIYKAHQEIQSAYGQIKQSLAQSSPVGDLAAATKIMKILDPGSVVRESELGMAMQATGIMDRVLNYGNMVMTGQKLTPSQRKDFSTLADRLMSDSAKAYNAKRAEYQRLGSEYGLDANRALGPDSAAPAEQRRVVDFGSLK